MFLFASAPDAAFQLRPSDQQVARKLQGFQSRRRQLPLNPQQIDQIKVSSIKCRLRLGDIAFHPGKDLAAVQLDLILCRDR